MQATRAPSASERAPKSSASRSSKDRWDWHARRALLSTPSRARSTRARESFARSRACAHRRDHRRRGTAKRGGRIATRDGRGRAFGLRWRAQHAERGQEDRREHLEERRALAQKIGEREGPIGQSDSETLARSLTGSQTVVFPPPLFFFPCWKSAWLARAHAALTHSSATAHHRRGCSIATVGDCCCTSHKCRQDTDESRGSHDHVAAQACS